MSEEGNGTQHAQVAASIVTQWTTSEVGRYLNRSRATVQRLVRSGALHFIPGPPSSNGLGRVRYFDPEEVKRVGATLTDWEDDDGESEGSAKANAIRDIVGHATDLTTESWGQNKHLTDRLLSHVERMTKETHHALMEENRRLSEDNKELRDGRKDVEDARDVIRQQLYDQTLAQGQVDRDLKKNEFLADAAKLVTSGLAARFFGGATTKVSFERFKASLTDDQREAFLNVPWNSQQLLWLSTMFDESGAATETEEPEQAPTATPGPTPPPPPAPAPAGSNPFAGFGCFDFSLLREEE